MSERSQQRIVCAANRLPDGRILIGVRHWDGFMHAQADDYLEVHKLEDEDIHPVEDGFIDQWGVFYGRRDAWEIAERAGQIIDRGPGYSGPELFSENLY